MRRIEWIFPYKTLEKKNFVAQNQFQELQGYKFGKWSWGRGCLLWKNVLKKEEGRYIKKCILFWIECIFHFFYCINIIYPCIVGYGNLLNGKYTYVPLLTVRCSGEHEVKVFGRTGSGRPVFLKDLGMDRIIFHDSGFSCCLPCDH